jgi:outer membrane protein OmpA-like peptidoglycan-associated protein
MRRSWLALLVSCLAVSPAAAQITGRPVELSVQGGYFQPDARDRIEAGLTYGGSLGLRFQSWLVLEGHALFAPSESELDGRSVSFTVYGADFRFNLQPAEGRVVPYLIAGAGYGQWDDDAREEALARGTPSLGAGLLVNAFGPRSYLRFQLRDAMFRGPDSEEFSNHFALTAGIHYLWGGRPRDQDLDGVRDWLDKCPGTPIGANVDANGCPVDSDADSVFDGIDECPNTPRGATVDAKGCPSDADADSVYDGLDRCPDTPAGASVDETGCPNDDDGDGVPRPADACEGTPRGCRVDARGCPVDADADGVCDGLDRCPDTPAGARVDSLGCPLDLMQRENELLDTGMIRIYDVRFASGSAEISSESLPVLETVGQALVRAPDLGIEIRGHTDDQGATRANQRLSEARAKSVLDHLRSRFPALSSRSFTTKGFGESRPIAPNTSEAGRARNRRIELVVTDRAGLRREIERRRLERSGQTPPPAPEESIRLPEPAPPDTTRR